MIFSMTYYDVLFAIYIDFAFFAITYLLTLMIVKVMGLKLLIGHRVTKLLPTKIKKCFRKKARFLFLLELILLLYTF